MAGDTFSCIGITGSPGSGKTTYQEQLIREAIAAGRKVKIMDPNGQFPRGYLPSGVRGEWPGVAGVDQWIAGNLGKFHGLLVLDDADAYVPKNLSRTSPWLDLFVSFRHYQLDIVFTTRRLQEVPPIMRSCISHAAIFRTRSHLERNIWSSNIPGLTRKIPREPYQFLFVDMDTMESEVYKTKPRAIETAADRKV